MLLKIGFHHITISCTVETVLESNGTFRGTELHDKLIVLYRYSVGHTMLLLNYPDVFHIVLESWNI